MNKLKYHTYQLSEDLKRMTNEKAVENFYDATSSQDYEFQLDVLKECIDFIHNNPCEFSCNGRIVACLYSEIDAIKINEGL